MVGRTYSIAGEPTGANAIARRQFTRMSINRVRLPKTSWPGTPTSFDVFAAVFAQRGSPLN